MCHYIHLIPSFPIIITSNIIVMYLYLVKFRITLLQNHKKNRKFQTIIIDLFTHLYNI